MSKDDITTGGPPRVTLPGTYAYAAPDNPVELPWVPPPEALPPLPDAESLGKFIEQLQPLPQTSVPARSSVLLALRSLRRELGRAEEQADVEEMELLITAITDIERCWSQR